MALKDRAGDSEVFTSNHRGRVQMGTQETLTLTAGSQTARFTFSTSQRPKLLAFYPKRVRPTNVYCHSRDSFNTSFLGKLSMRIF